MNYNSMFRVYDTGENRKNRYVVFASNSTANRGLILREHSFLPEGLSFWHSFEYGTSQVKDNSKEVSFNELPENLQQHVIARFKNGVTEAAMNYNQMFRVFTNHGDSFDRFFVFLSGEEKNPHAMGLGLSENPSHPQGFSNFGEFNISAIKSHMTEISFNDLPENVQQHVIDRFELTEAGLMKKVALNLLGGKRGSAKSLLKLIMVDKLAKKLKLKEDVNFGDELRLIGDDVVLRGKKVATFKNDLSDGKGILLYIDGKESEFDTIQDMSRFLFDKFINKKSTSITEATQYQKNVVKSLRKLAKKLNINQPRFRSLAGKTEYIQMSLANWEEDSIPNELRKKAVIKIFNAVPRDFSNVNYGGVRKEAMALTAPQWEQLLGFYGIGVEQPIAEGHKTVSSIDTDKYPNREHQGLEGPIRARNGKVVYYDKKEGKYYDPSTDIYISHEEWEDIDK